MQFQGRGDIKEYYRKMGRTKWEARKAWWTPLNMFVPMYLRGQKNKEWCGKVVRLLGELMERILESGDMKNIRKINTKKQNIM